MSDKNQAKEREGSTKEMLSFKDFTLRAIPVLAEASRKKAIEKGKTVDNTAKWKGCHAVYGKFNSLASEQFHITTDEVVRRVNELVAQGIIAKRAARGGPMLYLPQDAPVDDNAELLAAITGTK